MDVYALMELADLPKYDLYGIGLCGITNVSVDWTIHYEIIVVLPYLGSLRYMANPYLDYNQSVVFVPKLIQTSSQSSNDFTWKY